MQIPQSALMNAYIKSTQDGRKIEVIGSSICVDGKPEADRPVAVTEHPHWRSILQAAPDATHMAGPVALTVDEAEKAQRALNAAREAFDASPLGAAERCRVVINRMLMNRSGDSTPVRPAGFHSDCARDPCGAAPPHK